MPRKRFLIASSMLAFVLVIGAFFLISKDRLFRPHISAHWSTIYASGERSAGETRRAVPIARRE